MDSPSSEEDLGLEDEEAEGDLPFVDTPGKPTTSFGSNAQPNISAPMRAPVFDAFLQLSRCNKTKLVETHSDDFLRADWMKLDSLFVPPRIGMVQAMVTPGETSQVEPDASQWNKLAAQRLRHAKLVKTDDQIKWQALRKLKTLVLIDPSMSKLGRSLVSGVRIFTAESDWEASFSDAFQGKSVATVAKRAGALWRFNEWLVDSKLPPLVHTGESVMYRYMEHLKEVGSPSTASSLLQAWTFLHHSVGLLKYTLDEVLSSRVKGASRACLSRKKPLQQSVPLTVKMVVALENVVTLAPYEHWRIIAGHFLMCLGSCSRFGDSVRLTQKSAVVNCCPSLALDVSSLGNHGLQTGWR